MFEGLKFSRVYRFTILILYLYSNLGMARLSSFMGSFRIWRCHRNLCTVRTHLVTRYHIIQQVSTSQRYYFFKNLKVFFSRPLGLTPHLDTIRFCFPNIFPYSQFGFFLAGPRNKFLRPRAKKIGIAENLELTKNNKKLSSLNPV